MRVRKWEGATGVASWRVLTGSSATELNPAGSARKTSFETAIRMPQAAYVSVQALEASGRVIGVSPPQSVS